MSVANCVLFKQIEKLVFPVQAVVYFRSGRQEIERNNKKRTLRGYFIRHFPPVERKGLQLLPLLFIFFSFFFLPISALCKIAKLLCLLFFSFMQIEEKGRLSQVKKRKGGRARLLWVPEEKLKKTPNGQEVIIARFSNKLSTSAVRPS